MPYEVFIPAYRDEILSDTVNSVNRTKYSLFVQHSDIYNQQVILCSRFATLKISNIQTFRVAQAKEVKSLQSPRQWHVSISGNDSADGSATAPLRHIQTAAERAYPGDVVIVHEGVYRERVAPPRGGESKERPITYQAAEGEKVFTRSIYIDFRNLTGSHQK